MAVAKPSRGKTSGSRTQTKSKASAGPSKGRLSKGPKAPPPKQQKTKSAPLPAQKKKKRVYTDKELGLPKLNMITPAGVDHAKGKKKGKVFVDDQEGMMTILAIVNADKEGQIESKMMKSRHLEEIREARRNEMEARQSEKKSKLDETKNSIRRKRKRKLMDEDLGSPASSATKTSNKQPGYKKVAFAS